MERDKNLLSVRQVDTAKDGWLTDGVLSACIDGNHFPEHPFTA